MWAEADNDGGPRLPVPLRPMTLADLLDGGFRVLRCDPRAVFGIAAAIVLPVALLTAYVERGQTFFQPAGVGAVVVAALMASIAPFFLGGALAALVTGWYSGRRLTAGEALAASFRRTGAFVVAFLIVIVPKALSFAFCLLPALVVIPLFSLTAPAIVVERLGPWDGVVRSVTLVSRRFWWAVFVTDVASLGVYALSRLWRIVGTDLAGILAQPWSWIVSGLLNGALDLVFVTALLAVSVLLYLDLRVRTEGLDIELGVADAFGRAG